MKQLKVPKVLPPPAETPTPRPAPEGPRHRYFSTPPTVVMLRLGDLAAGVPAGIRSGAFDPEREVELPCGDIFNGPVPTLSLGWLARVAPECFRTQNFSDTSIKLPAARLALAYKLITGSEIIEEPVVPEAEYSAFAPVEENLPEPEISAPVEIPVNRDDSFAAPEPGLQELPIVEPEPRAEIPAVELPQAESPLAVTPIEPVTAEPPFTPVLPTPLAPPAKSRTTILPQSKRPFTILPIFRRKEADPEPEPADPQARPRVEIPKPKAPLVPLIPKPPQPTPPENFSEAPAPSPVLEPVTAPTWQEPPVVAPMQTIPSVAEAGFSAEEPPPVEENGQTPQPLRTEAVLVETEHLPKVGEKVPSEIPEQETLQAIFMTEEFLAVDRVVELCGGLPGIKSCVLSHGSAVLASHNVPDTIDLVSLSAHAVEMLSGMRASSAKMGIGAVPAVTVHSEKGPITFFHQDDLCLFVMHKDRGFIPGVREKLQQVVEELTRANLPLPISSARPVLEKWK